MRPHSPHESPTFGRTTIVLVGVVVLLALLFAAGVALIVRGIA